jgi:hypothetical protein
VSEGLVKALTDGATYITWEGDYVVRIMNDVRAVEVVFDEDRVQ